MRNSRGQDVSLQEMDHGDEPGEGCLGDTALVALAEGTVPASEREALLQHADECELCAALLGQAVRLTSDERTALGRYQIVGELGRGAMGRVLLAFDPQLRRDVALKVVRDDTSGRAASLRRLRREAQALARLRHPNVVEVYDVQESGDELFIAMEYVRGQSLAHWLDEAPREPAEIVAFLADASRGLEAAHAAGVVHRDFKPANVMVTDERRVVVVDFGLAAMESTLAPTSPGSPEHGTSEATYGAGTPVYMAPEQWDGEATPASDQFALCLTLVEAIAGAWPYPTSSAARLRAAKRRGVLDPDVLRRLPQHVEAAVRRGLAPRPSNRWPSMAALRVALVPRRRRWPRIVGLGVVVAALIGFASTDEKADVCERADASLTAAWSADRGREIAAAFRRSGAEAPDVTAEAVGAALDGYAEKWRAAFTDACHAAALPRTPADRDPDATLRCLRDARDEIAVLTDTFQEANADLVVQAVDRIASLPRLEACGRAPGSTVTQTELDPRSRALAKEITRARLLLSDNAVEQAGADADRLLAEARRTDSKPVLLDALLLRAEVGSYEGDPRQDAVPAEAFALARELGNDRDAALAALIGATAASRRGRDEEARRWLDLARIDLARDADPLLLARYATVESGLYMFRGELGQGIALSQASVEYQAAADPGGLKHAVGLANLAGSYRVAGYHQAAAFYLEEARRIIVARGGAAHPLLQHIRIELGAIAYETGHPDAAVREFEQAVALFDRHLGPRAKEGITARQGLAMAHFDLRQYDEAAASIEAALEVAAEVEFQATDEAFLWLVLAEARRAQGDAEAAETAYVHGLGELHEAPSSPRRDELEAGLQRGRDALR